MRLQSAKCLVENSIVDGLKLRLMQYLSITLTAGVDSPIITAWRLFVCAKTNWQRKMAVLTGSWVPGYTSYINTCVISIPNELQLPNILYFFRKNGQNISATTWNPWLVPQYEFYNALIFLDILFKIYNLYFNLA